MQCRKPTATYQIRLKTYIPKPKYEVSRNIFFVMLPAFLWRMFFRTKIIHFPKNKRKKSGKSYPVCKNMNRCNTFWEKQTSTDLIFM